MTYVDARDRGCTKMFPSVMVHRQIDFVIQFGFEN